MLQSFVAYARDHLDIDRLGERRLKRYEEERGRADCAAHRTHRQAPDCHGC